MTFRRRVEAWKYPAILLFGIGTSNFGAWVYLIALNLIVLDLTQSPLAVAGLYIARPMAALLTNTWAGSVIDRINKRRLLISLDVFRSVLIAVLPFASSMWTIYALVLVINMAGAMFEPASMAYITKLIPAEKRQRFNSLRSLIDSGAFLIGPAIAGILFMIGTPTAAIYINAVALLLSALVLAMMPDLEKGATLASAGGKVSWSIIREDWRIVLEFSRASSRTMLVFMLFSCMVVMATAIDSQEASFAKAVLFLTDSEYGFLVSIAGGGIIAGSVINALFAKKFKTHSLIGFGSLMVAAGYLIYAFSNSYAVAAVGFFFLAFALAFANTGFHTFTQNNIPVEKMGRIVGMYSLAEAFLIIIATGIVGVAAQVISIQPVVIAAVFVMLAIAILLFIVCIKQPASGVYLLTEKETEAAK
ncbi:MFS family permease [Planomicrobium koreense]|uniref:MFS family permease n=1 Tax=Planococcus koreensis TaxID=112331 RepID=A0A7W8CU79_9BACL|nr:MFS transporter [Planococcus koreensis]MBB5180944.1 MFS family permease [Planococcus koreensis]